MFAAPGVQARARKWAKHSSLRRNRPSPATSPRRSAVSRKTTIISRATSTSSRRRSAICSPSCRRKASRPRAANGRSNVCRSSRRISICSRLRKARTALKVLKKLIKRDDVDALINACDAGREGELIFRNIVRYTKAKQPIKRLWLQSMTPAAIREGFEQLARATSPCCRWPTPRISRSEADWLVGINGTRAMTAFNSKLGGFFKTTVGRVQTPTLAIVVEREAEDPQIRVARFLGGHRHVRRGGGAIHRPLVR